MKLKLQKKRSMKKTKYNRQISCSLKFAVAPVRKLIMNRRAISAVLSNMILIAAVVMVGFTALIWSQNQASDYQKQYGAAINADMIQLKERISLEYATYNGGTLKIYLMNWHSRRRSNRCKIVPSLYFVLTHQKKIGPKIS